MKRVILFFAAILLLCAGCQAEESSDSISRVSRSKPSETLSYESGTATSRVTYESTQMGDNEALKVIFDSPSVYQYYIVLTTDKKLSFTYRYSFGSPQRESVILSGDEYDNIISLVNDFERVAKSLEFFDMSDAWTTYIIYGNKKYECRDYPEAPELKKLTDAIIDLAPFPIDLFGLA